MIRGLATCLLALTASGAMPSGAMPLAAGDADPAFAGWREVRWPLAADAFGRGRAFRCDAGQCGQPVTVVVRPKIGLCGCKASIADDDELQRFSDLDADGHPFRGAGAGRPVTVGRLNGRAQAYTADDGRRVSALAVAYHDRCDLIVATAWVDGEAVSPALQARALRLLDSRPVTAWLEVRLGL